ncbi:hypothetical protein N7466_007451 [Penicillium verhagenii]|uniref:uncharacterized protein n=1 Tax=Penicillium verhagenii TaxID=1562060 RepID=UPI002545ABD3|nr:uncharacterized protein N7466_007451 [Penicillium verhagenii]KAJ5928495.1 hypothetical protein N7466_007451 [Penicillium verhagenii]
MILTTFFSLQHAWGFLEQERSSILFVPFNTSTATNHDGLEICSAASQALINPVHKTYLTFYAAISYELLGRAAHIYSTRKINLLRLALENFANCGSALPPLVGLPRLPKIAGDLSAPPSPTSIDDCLASFEPMGGVPSGRDSMVDSITRLIDASICGLDDPFLDSSDEASNGLPSPSPSPPRFPGPIETSPEQDILAPSPLSIRKVSDQKVSWKVPPKNPARLSFHDNENVPKKIARLSIGGDENAGQSKRDSRYRPPRLPLKVIPSSQLNANQSAFPSPQTDLSSPACITPLFSRSAPMLPTPDTTPQEQESNRKTISTVSIDDLTPARAAQIVRSNRGIALLREQITSSIFEIRQQIRKVKEIQEVHRTRSVQRASSFWTFDPILEEDKENEASLDSEPIMDEFGHILVKETIYQRIIRLRSEGWDTVGLRSPRSTWKGARYYQELCTMVMTEQDLDS